jgi:outer membrane protein assembly factor BamD
MKKAVIIFILLCFSWSAHSFWIWSPKTKKWKNPQHSALATPYLQYKQALKQFEEEQYKEAYGEFKKLLTHYPDSKEAAEAQYHLAICLEKLGKSYEAFLEYQKIIDSYPNSQRINEVVEREYKIGESFLNREPKKLMGLSFYDFVEHPSIEIFNRIIEKAPYSEFAPLAQYKLGIILMRLGRYDESRDAFQKVIDNYPDSEWASPAKYQLALATAKAFPGADYDSTYLKEATSRLDEFLRDHPEAQISAEAEEQLENLRNQEAKKQLGIAEFYEKQDRYQSAVTYYQKIVSNYSDSDYYARALAKIQELESLIDKKITKKDLKRKEKTEAAEEKKLEKLNLKEEKLAKKQALRDKKLDKKASRNKEKTEAKAKKVEAEKEHRDKAKELKQAKREKKLEKNKEKIKKKDEAKAKKAQAKAKKIEAKKEHRDKAKEIKLAKTEEKLKKKAEKIKEKEEKLNKKRQAKARKQAVKARKKSAVLDKQKQLKSNKQKAYVLYQEALSSYLDKNYSLAYNKFRKVQELVPNYSSSAYYLKVISKTIKIEQEQKTEDNNE